MDSIKFSGDLVAGLSLGSTRAMFLTPDVDSDPNTLQNSELVAQEMIGMDQIDSANVKLCAREGGVGFPTKLTMVLPPRSIYLMQGIWR